MNKTIFQTIPLVLCLLLLAGCESEMQKSAERPDWLKGNAYEVLSGRGNYDLFLQAIDRAGMRDVVDGKGLCTVFAPDDEAMKRYLGDKTPEEMPLQELKVLVGMHIVEYSFNASQLLDFQHKGESIGQSTPAGLNYKQKTFAKEDICEMTDPVTGKKHKVYYKEKYLPILSTRLFTTRKLANPQSDYAFFFPGSRWYGADDKLYVANAGVKEYAVPTDNGYVYLVDDVIKPLRTVYRIMQDNPADYSVFRGVYDHFAEMKYDKDISAEHAATGDSLFFFYHRDLPKIASEWTYNNENPGGMYAQKLSGTAFNMVVPDNAAMQEYLTDFFEGNYSSYDELPLLTLFYLARNHVKDGDLIFPDNFRQGESSIYGDKYDLDPERDIRYRELASNGTFYGVGRVISPAMFRSVTAPVFKNNDYSIFAYMMHKSKELSQLISMENEYSLFIPTNEVFEKFMNLRMNYGDGVWGNEKLERETEPGVWKAVSDAEMIEIAQQHIVLGKIEDFQAQRIWRTKANLTYVVTDGGEVRGEGSEGVVPAKGWSDLENGAAYEIGSILKKSENSLVKTLQMSDRFTAFYAKLVEAGLVDKDGIMPSLAGEQAVVFALDNDAMRQAVVPTDKQKLADWLSYYFVSIGVNKLNDYILPGFKMDGDYFTLSVDRVLSTPYETVYYKVRIEDRNGRLYVSNPSGGNELAAQDFPQFASDGVVYSLSQPLGLE